MVVPPRQLEILKLIADGYSNKEIAVRLGVNLKTVYSHREALNNRFGVNSTAMLVRAAIRHGLVEP